MSLNITLPAHLYPAATSTQPLAPKISGTYSPDDYLDMVKARQHQFGTNLEDVNRAAMSGSARLTSAAVEKASAFESAYHASVREQFKPKQSQGLLGEGRTMTLKGALDKMKLM
jgi:hypothetical protein